MLVAASFVAQPAPPLPPVPCGGGDRVEHYGISVRVLAPGLSLTRILARRTLASEGKPTSHESPWVEQSLDGPIDSQHEYSLSIEDEFEDHCTYDLMAYVEGSTKPIVQRGIDICDVEHVWEIKSKRHHRYVVEPPSEG